MLVRRAPAPSSIRGDGRMGISDGAVSGADSPKEPHPSGPVSLALMAELRKLPGEPLHLITNGNVTAGLHHAGKSLWLVLRWRNGASLGCCLAWSAGEKSQLVQSSSHDGKIRCGVKTLAGRYDVTVERCRSTGMFHWRTTFRPSAKMIVPLWPADLYARGEGGDPLKSAGTVHTHQQGMRAAFLYATITHPVCGSFLYLQNLTALNPYFAQTHTSPKDCIQSRWPELGFALPPSPEQSLRADQEVVVSDAWIVCSPRAPRDEREASRQFLDLYGRLYLQLPKPDADHRDWPRRVEDTIHDLTHSPLCTVERHGHRYLLAYVAADDRPPESMVQLAVLIPLLECRRQHDRHIPLIDDLCANLPTFYDPRVRAVVRWLPADRRLLRGQEEQMKENVMDSWYHHHTCMNLARLVAFGNGPARKLFLDSVEYAIRVAQRFEYRWPVFYDLFTLDVLKPETEPGRGGELDVGAQYVHVMQQAWKLTKEKRFVAEAERAAQRLTGLGFELGYQLNNTSFGAGALVWLWRQTGNDLYRQLSEVCLANIVQHFWLWECQYGNARHYQTFLGLPPLRGAPYLATYEELELLAAFHEYVELAGDSAPPALRILLPEYCKYLIDRAWHHYPSELPKDVLAPKPNSGKLSRYISVPLEDVYEGWQPAGQVGQQVYGAAAPFVFSTRHCHYVDGIFHVACEYPVRELKKTPQQFRFAILGHKSCACHVRVVPSTYARLPQITAYVGSRRKKIAGVLNEHGYLEFKVPGDAEFILEWSTARTARPTVEKRARRTRQRSTAR